MLSIRTQDRMALVPYKERITIYQGKVVNDVLIENAEKFNAELQDNLRKQASSDNISFDMLGRTGFENKYENLYEKQKKEVPEPIYDFEISLGDYPLGTYATKERALEVLDEIEEVILSANMWVGDGIAVDKVPPQNRIHQMPKE